MQGPKQDAGSPRGEVTGGDKSPDTEYWELLTSTGAGCDLNH